MHNQILGLTQALPGLRPVICYRRGLHMAGEWWDGSLGAASMHGGGERKLVYACCSVRPEVLPAELSLTSSTLSKYCRPFANVNALASAIMAASAVASPELSFRAYGNQNFERFDNVLAGDASLGRTAIGKVEVDCRFLFTKSQWGVLKARENPAGIIYLDLSFSQPRDCRLKKVTVTLTLDDDDEELRTIPNTSYGHAKVPVQIGAIGPEKFGGQAKRVYRTKRNQFVPHVEGGGMVGFGGVGRESEEHSYKESRWQFSGKKETNPKSTKNSWAYKVIRWELEENELESQSTHSNVIHTGFSFEHDGQPFFMQVEVGGELESRRSEFVHRMSKWKKSWRFPADPRAAPCATTLINFGGRNIFHKPLDELERGLALAMENANMNAVPIQIPNPRPATFHDETPGGEAWTATVEALPAVAAPTPNLLSYRRESSFVRHRPGRVTPRRTSLLEPGPTLPTVFVEEEAGGRPAPIDRSIPTTENLAYAFDFWTRSPATQLRPTARAEARRRQRMRRQAAIQPEEVEIEGEPRRRQPDRRTAASRQPSTMIVDTSDASSITLLNREQSPEDMATDDATKKPHKKNDMEAHALLLLILSWFAHIMKALGTHFAEGSKIVVPDSDTSSDEESEVDKVYGSPPRSRYQRGK